MSCRLGRSERINAFFQQLTRERVRNGESFVAVLELGDKERVRFLAGGRDQPAVGPDYALWPWPVLASARLARAVLAKIT
jgi:hypothetical protein